MIKKLSIEFDDFRDIVSITESAELWRILWTILDDIEQVVLKELNEHECNKSLKNDVCDGIQKITNSYRERIKPFDYTMHGYKK